MPALVAFAGLGTDLGVWFYTHKKMQSAAESAAFSAATAGSNLTVEASAVTAAYGFANGTNGVTVTVNQPPRSGTHTATAGAIEVVIQQPETPLFSSIFMRSFTISGRAVAVGTPGTGCVLALNGSASGAISSSGSATVTLNNCNLYDNSSSGSALTVGGSTRVSALSVGVVGGISGTVTTTNGVYTRVAAMTDPYASASFGSFSGCNVTNFNPKSNITISQGVYCGGMTLTAGVTVTLNPGIYYLDQGSLSVAGNATLQGTGVTLVFTSSTNSNWASASIKSNAVINLVAPTSGPTAGIVIFGDRNMTTGTSFSLTGGGTQTFGGSIYLPNGALSFSGSTDATFGCTQVIADTITFSGGTDLSINCGGFATKSIGNGAATLLE